MPTIPADRRYALAAPDTPTRPGRPAATVAQTPRGRRLRLTLLLGALLLTGWSLACRTPTTLGPGAYSWQFLGYTISGRDLVASGPVTSGPWSIQGSPVDNPTSEARRVKLSTTATLSVSYSGSFEDFGGEVDHKDSVRLSVTTTLPAYSVAILETRRQTQTDFYRFDVRCRWLNTVTGERRSTLHLRDVDGSVRHSWYDDRVSIDRLR